jgi:hypothetical protein
MVLLLIAFLVSDPFAALFQADGQAVLEGAPSITLMSIEPHATYSGKNEFHGYRILSEIELRGDSKSKLLGKLYTGIAEEAHPARCFNPRHAIRAKNGDRYVHLVICFECGQIKSWVNGKSGGSLVSSSPEETFNAFLATPAPEPLRRRSGPR